MAFNFDQIKNRAKSLDAQNTSVDRSLTPSAPQIPKVVAPTTPSISKMSPWNVPMVTPGSKKEKEEQRKAIVKNSWLENYNLSLPGIGRAYAQANPQIAQNAVDETNMFINEKLDNPMERFAFGAFDKINPAGSALNNLERTVGDLDTEKLDKSIAYQAGNMAGYMGQYALSGGLGIESAVFNGMKALPRVAGMGKIASPLLRGVTSNAVGGLPINVTTSLDESVQDGKVDGGQFAKSMAINTAIDTVLGGAVEGISALARLRRYSKAKQDEVIEKVAKEVGMTDLEKKAFESNVRKGKITPDGDTLYGNAPQPIAGELPAPSRVYQNKTAPTTKVPKLVDKPGADKIKAKSDVYKEIKTATGVKDPEDAKRIADVIKKLDTEVKDGWDTDDFWKEIIDVTKRQEYDKVDPEKLYPGLKKEIRETPIRITGDLKQITDFNALRKKSMGKVKLSKNGKPMDELYMEWNERYPDLFPESITHPTDQLETLIKVSDSLKPTIKRVGDVMSDDDLWNGPLMDVWKAVNKYQSTVKETAFDGLPKKYNNPVNKIKPDIYARAKGQKEVPRTVNPLEVSQKASNKAVQPPKVESKPVAPPKKETPKTEPKMEVKNAESKRDTVPTEARKLDTKTERVLEKLNNRLRERGEDGDNFYEVIDHPRQREIKVLADLFKSDVITVKPLKEVADTFHGVHIEGEDVIAINLSKTTNPAHVVYGHEVMHQVQLRHPEGYKRFLEVFVKSLDENKIKRYREILEADGKMSDEDMLKEITADFSGEMFNDPKIMRRIFEEDRTVAKWIYDTITEMITKIKDAYVVSTSLKDLKAVQDEYVKLMREARLKDARPDKPGMKFSMKKPVEETKDLLAIHNLSAEKLKGAFELGGFPVPSIAIIKSGTGHESFGDISLVFSKDTISPTNRLNRVFSSDIYSTRFPQVSHKLNEKAVNRINKKVDALLKDVEYASSFNRYIEESNMADKIERSRGDFVDAYKDDPMLQLAYMKEMGKPFKPVTRAKTYGGWEYDLLDSIGKRFKEITDKSWASTEETLAIGPELREMVNEYYKRLDERRTYFKDELGFGEIDRILDKVRKFKSDSSRTEVDTFATQDKLKKVVNQKGFEKWLSELSDGLVEKKGIRNNTELFTRSGNRRSWDQLHEDYSLENVTRVMKGNPVDNEGFNFGIGNIRANLSKEFKTISDIKANKDKLVSYDDFVAFKEQVEGEFSDLANRFSGYHNSGKSFGFLDTFSNTLGFTARKGVNRQSLIRELKSDGFDVDDIPADIIDDALNFLNKLKNAPTEYFEAKPQRPVRFDEVMAVVLPKDTNKEIVSKLKEMNVNVVKYDRNVLGDRTNKLNSMDKMKFSMKRGMDDGNARLEAERKLLKEEANAKHKKYSENASEIVDAEVGETGAWVYAKDIVDKGIGRHLDIQRIVDYGFKKSAEGRKWFKEAFEDNFYKSKGEYTKSVKSQTDTLYNEVVKKRGIWKGSKESAGMQQIGEGMKLVKDGKEWKAVEYTLDDLKKDFNYTMKNGKKAWENIVEAEKVTRKMYDDYVERINESLRKIYPNVEANVEDIYRRAMKAKLETGNLVHSISRGNQGVVQKVDGDSVTVHFKNQETGKEATVVMDRKDLMNEKHARELEDATVGKRLYPRQNYYRHFSEMQGGFLVGLDNIVNGATNIDPRLIDITRQTQPNSKFSGFLQHRGKGTDYLEDAVGGMLEYIPQAEYKINIEPNIPVLRKIIKELQEATVDSKNANDLIDNLIHVANDLAGKSNPIDRMWGDVLGDARGRRWLNGLSRVSNRVRANAVMGNMNTMIAQFFNFPNVVAYTMQNAKGTGGKGIAEGIQDALKAYVGNREVQAILNKSMFLQERYLDRSFRRFDKGIAGSADQLFSYSMELGDKIVADGAFLTFYRQNIAKGMSEADAVLKADELTRKSVAGRGIGEMPLSQKSKTVKLLMPFQVEVRNSINVLKEMGVSKDPYALAGIFVGMFGTSMLMNIALEETTGREIGLDPYGMILDAIKDEDAKSIPYRLFGNLMTNYPGGSYIADVLKEALGLDNYVMQSMFKDQDPSRFGTGNIALDTIGKPVGTALKQMSNPKDTKTNIDLLNTASMFLPKYGGKQIERTVRGLQDMALLPKEKLNVNSGVSLEKRKLPASYTATGMMRFPIEKTPLNYALAPTLGVYATKQGKDYITKERQYLREGQTAKVEKSADPIGSYEKIIYQRAIDKFKKEVKEIKKNPDWSDKKKNKEIVEKIRERIKVVKDSGYLTEQQKKQEVLKLQGEILKYK